jgi:hypothetical protein
MLLQLRWRLRQLRLQRKHQPKLYVTFRSSQANILIIIIKHYSELLLPDLSPRIYPGISRVLVYEFCNRLVGRVLEKRNDMTTGFHGRHHIFDFHHHNFQFLFMQPVHALYFAAVKLQARSVSQNIIRKHMLLSIGLYDLAILDVKMQ